ncbi:Response regulator receiver domain-containing protein [Halopseudomonas sabulinigri]|uniref:Response regulator receiver domain-containing protein n=1 Tax=Halopseudomonas sabulinigri TaxID=472181 RepID=A0A1H1MKL1_9GAMM|nr:response regulator [Halopseudomonas sabulinigri]SDR87381.1 Response regulator receiver domain-containing protein [Halopseudomonas sabulinigri]
MRLLLVEDEGPKSEKITSCLVDVFPGIDINLARSVRSALKKLDLVQYDLVVLDMSLPTFDISEDEHGGRPQGFGGVEVMRDMVNYEMITPVIVVTAYEYFSVDSDEDLAHGKESTLIELKCELGDEFPEIFIELIKYDTFTDEWQTQLVESIMAIEGLF